MVRRSGLDRIDETFEFFRRVEFVDGCWVWLHPRRDRADVADVRIGKILMRPKRLAWLWWCGELEPEWAVTSMCGNQLCVNPMHLRHAPRGFELWAILGHCERFHPLDLSRVKIRNSGKFIVCMDCHNTKRRENYQKNKYKNRRSQLAHS